MDEKQISELLECSVCLERLDQGCKVLPCQHTFCRQCLDEIVLTQKELRCPECRALVTVRVSDLPTNILVVRILEGLKSKGQRPPASNRQLLSTLGSSPAKVSSPLHRHDVAAQLLRQGSQPCAEALYKYEPTEKDDLPLEKGDIVILRRQIDENWYQGELLSGRIGFFPANFVQILVPLPHQIPQCRALYDFELKDEAEKDCLSFKKDEMLTVIRRVDENWLEGRKGDKIGIFPISFVELNDAARTLILSKSNAAQPSLPVSSRSVTKTPHSSAVSSTSTPAPDENSLPVSSDAPVVSSSSPETQPTSSPTSVPLGSSPTHEVPAQNKRHSFTSVSHSSSPVTTSASASNPQQRHSAEVSLSASVSHALVNLDIQPSTTVSSTIDHQSVTSRNTSSPSNVSDPTVDSTGNLQSGSLTIPLYIALYNYRPQKDDELELQKGDHYTVAEKCQDGWFKGACVRTGQCGVFPGNYVSMVRHTSAFKPVSPNILNIRAKGPVSTSSNAIHPSSGTVETKPTACDQTSSQVQAPPLMPRLARLNTSAASSHFGLSRPLIPAPPPSMISSPHHSMWAPPGLTTPQGTSVTAHSLDSGAASSTTPAKEKKEKKEKEKKGLSKLLSGKGKKSKLSVSINDPVPSPGVPCSDSITHVRSGSFPVDSSIDFPIGSITHRKAASFDATTIPPVPAKPRPKIVTRERYYCKHQYPPQTDHELALEVGDIIHVHRKRDDGWYKGTQERTGKTGMFPASFVEKCD
ncbi:E3 ubiquitin-protein ligase SH3RF3-like isoform X2 [Physella acuta]|uniref:E3 ubiquitin-protein ligase SH3RF3-like isoform X2 n=1 Tax=Physella acuta TaxID=109671 RepID=UPI0027DC0DAC|nr:E3 ubiquitin-protein ligase SH3RF3-like isoform X2 [Physella acuta]